jgi:hypothetical protein
MRSPARRPKDGNPLSDPSSATGRGYKDGEAVDLRRPSGVKPAGLGMAPEEMGLDVGRDEMFSVFSVIVLSLWLRSM